MTSFSYASSTFSTDRCPYTPSLQQAIQSVMPLLSRQLRSFAWFNLFFLVLGTTEAILLLFFFTFLIQTALLALTVAAAFFTCFAYFMLKLYLQARKQEKFEEILNLYTEACRQILQATENSPEYHLSLAHAYSKLASHLERMPVIYGSPAWLKAYVEKYSHWSHWMDIHKMRELLFQASIKEHIKLVKHEPTNMALHAALANSYVMLSELYNPSQKEGTDLFSPRYIPDMEKKFRAIAERAIEEFKILKTFAPDDPWVHAQLAYSYRDLNMPLEEIKEYETILKLNPNDPETMFKLGMRYFQQGFNAQGLKIYEQLKRFDIMKAEDLIAFYGAYEPISII